ncbi:MAG: alpha/beta hydrolase [Bacteroidota bacterium]
MLTLLLLLPLLYLIVALLMYRYQEKFIFFPTTLALDYPFPQFHDFEEVFLEVEAGTRLHALYFLAPEPKGQVLYFHGNARAVDDWGYAAADLRDRGYSVLMPDYRGYGKSTGTISEAALYADARRWCDWLEASAPEARLLYYGRSLGSGIASRLAYERPPERLILETPYTSLLAMAKLQMGFLPVDLLSRYRFPTDQIMEDIDCPIDLIHGTEDELIPYAQAQQLGRGRATLHTIPGGGHNDLSQFPAFHQVLDQLL